MIPITIERTVNLVPEELFAVVADIEAYPDFLPHCVKTRIVMRTENVWLVDHLFRWGPLPFCFRTEATVSEPTEISIRSLADAPFDLRINWRFDRRSDATKVTFEMALELPGPGLTRLFARPIRQQAKEMEELFMARAIKIKDRRAAQPSSRTEK